MIRRDRVEDNEPMARRSSAADGGPVTLEPSTSTSHAAGITAAHAAGGAAQDDSALVRRLIARIADLEQKLYQTELVEPAAQPVRQSLAFSGESQRGSTRAAGAAP